MSREEAIEEIRYYCEDSEEIIKALEQKPDIDKVIATIDFERKWLYHSQGDLIPIEIKDADK